MRQLFFIFLMSTFAHADVILNPRLPGMSGSMDNPLEKCLAQALQANDLFAGKLMLVGPEKVLQELEDVAEYIVSIKKDSNVLVRYRLRFQADVNSEWSYFQYDGNKVGLYTDAMEGVATVLPYSVPAMWVMPIDVRGCETQFQELLE